MLSKWLTNHVRKILNKADHNSLGTKDMWAKHFWGKGWNHVKMVIQEGECKRNNGNYLSSGNISSEWKERRATYKTEVGLASGWRGRMWPLQTSLFIKEWWKVRGCRMESFILTFRNQRRGDQVAYLRILRAGIYYDSGVSKAMGQIWPRACCCKEVFLEHSHDYSFMYCPLMLLCRAE